MMLQEIIQELEAIKAELNHPNNRYRSYYALAHEREILEQRFTNEVENSASDPDGVVYFRTLNIVIIIELNRLMDENKAMIWTLDFDRECEKLINAGDYINLNGLIDIGKHYGVKSKAGRNITGALEYVLSFYQANASKRTATNKPCLDYLCDLLDQPILEIPTNNATSSTSSGFSFNLPGNPTKFQTSQDTIKHILKENSIEKLKTWLVNASVEDRHFALRAACDNESSFDCLRFLLLKTKPEDNGINILARSKYSLQCAMHRAIRSGSSVIVGTMLESNINESPEILRQLFVKDKNNLTPMDYLVEIKDYDNFPSILKTIYDAVKQHQQNEQLALSADDFNLIKEKISMLSRAAPSLLM